MAVSKSVPTASQIASAQVHLSQRSEWVTIRVKGVRYVVMPNSSGERRYWVRADGKGCECDAYQKWNYSACSHMLAVREANNHDALESWLSEPVQPKPADKPAPIKTYEDLFPVCAEHGCDEEPKRNSKRCWRHAPNLAAF